MFKYHFNMYRELRKIKNVVFYAEITKSHVYPVSSVPEK
jgi:hypothetical protein